MTDTKLRALNAALEFWRAVSPVNWNYPAGMMGGGHHTKHGGDYTAQQIVDTAKVFESFLDPHLQPKKRK